MNDKTIDILKVNNVTTGYKNGHCYNKVSKDLTLNMERASFIALLGPNGCGKSTLLRTIAGLQEPFDGSVSINQIKIQKLKTKDKARLLSLVLTDKIDSSYLLVKDIVGVGRYPHTGKMGILSTYDEKIINESITKCNLKHYAETAYSELSDGEKQRVMLARALAQDTPLMMLDEPTSHLDLPNRVALMKMLRDLSKETNTAILLSTHELDLAMQWCDGIWLMNEKGEIIKGAPEDLVLNGSFSKVFSNKSFFFDIASGTFKINIEPKAYIYVTGDEIIKEWTRRALEREGFALITDKENADLTIHISEGKWVIKYKDQTQIQTSIAKLLISIKKIISDNTHSAK